MYLFILLTLVGARTELYSEKIEARVGNQIITSTDLRAEVTQLQDRANEAKTDSTLRKKALEMLIEKALIRNYLSHQQMDVSEQDVDRRVNSIRASQGLSNLDEFRKLLESRGMSLRTLRRKSETNFKICNLNKFFRGKLYKALMKRNCDLITATISMIFQRILLSIYKSVSFQPDLN